MIDAANIDMVKFCNVMGQNCGNYCWPNVIQSSPLSPLLLAEIAQCINIGYGMTYLTNLPDTFIAWKLNEVSQRV